MCDECVTVRPLLLVHKQSHSQTYAHMHTHTHIHIRIHIRIHSVQRKLSQTAHAYALRTQHIFDHASQLDVLMLGAGNAACLSRDTWDPILFVQSCQWHVKVLNSPTCQLYRNVCTYMYVNSLVWGVAGTSQTCGHHE
jgi:hypothetical protein